MVLGLLFQDLHEGGQDVAIRHARERPAGVSGPDAACLPFALAGRFPELAAKEARHKRAGDCNAEAHVAYSHITRSRQQRSGDPGAQGPTGLVAETHKTYSRGLGFSRILGAGRDQNRERHAQQARCSRCHGYRRPKPRFTVKNTKPQTPPAAVVAARNAARYLLFATDAAE